MAKAKKLTKEELEAVRTAVGNVNTLTSRVGQVEIQKSQLLNQVLTAQAQVVWIGFCKSRNWRDYRNS